jgi:excisionase family DNA binding protein
MNPRNFRAPAPTTSQPATHCFNKAKAIARRLGVHPRTIFRWADDGKLARHKINARVVLFDEQEVEALLMGSRVEVR